MRRRRRVVVDQRRAEALLRGAVAGAGREHLRRRARADGADQRGGGDDRRERHVEGEDRDEGRRREAPHPAVLQRARADAVRGVQDDRGDRRLEAIEHAGDERHVAEAQVDPGQRDQDRERRQHEQRAGDDAAYRAVHQPAEVGGELLRLGAGQQHAVVQRVQEALLADPAPAFDELGVHDRDLPRRAAEADEAELEPEAQRLGKAHRPGRRFAHGVGAA